MGAPSTFKELPVADRLYRVRHSLAHVLAHAVLDMRPGTKLGFGPAIDDGFYYDFIFPSGKALGEEDFPEIEKRMKKLIGAGAAFEFEELPVSDAFARIEGEMGEPYKRQYAAELVEKGGLKTISFYRSGAFLDMCEGPHVEKTNQIPADGFKLRSLAGAYWRGDSRNVMMTRIYAYAYLTRDELQAKIRQVELALERDHKKLGKELEIFLIDDEIGKGLPLWLPNGTVLRDELEKFAKEMEFKAGYQRISTPFLAKTALYHRTGHLPYYADSMYPFMELKERHETAEGVVEEVKESYVLKPMNCPHHHKVYGHKPRSYRDLPLRLAEYGQCHRFEDSGALSGLLRVRGMCMNDAHIYCTAEQAHAELLAVLDMYREAYAVFGLTDYAMRFSTWDPEDPKGKSKYVNDPAGWERAQRILKEALDASGIPYTEGKGEAAFYGPKMDMQLKTVTGREESLSTNQLDFAMAERLGLAYTGADNAEHRPYIIHRAPLSTHERLVAFLIEHYGGAFPTWMAPVQARVVTVSDKFKEYADQVVAELRADGVRAEVDSSGETMGKKIRNATKQKVPNTLVVGEKEMLDGTVTLRRYGIEEQKAMPLAEFRAWVGDRIRRRARD